MQIKQSNVVFINKNNTAYSPNFKAKEYAIIRTFAEDTPQTLKVFRLDGSDTKVLEEMYEKINLKKLNKFKNATELQLQRWKYLINNAVTMSRFESPHSAYLLTTENNKPCAMISYSTFNKKTLLDTLVAWPIKAGENVKLAGTVLLKMLYERAVLHSTKSIKADVLTKGPMDAEAFYKKRGFSRVKKELRRGNDYEIKANQIRKVVKQLNSLINIERIENPKEVDLKSTLDISF